MKQIFWTHCEPSVRPLHTGAINWKRFNKYLITNPKLVSVYFQHHYSLRKIHTKKKSKLEVFSEKKRRGFGTNLLFSNLAETICGDFVFTNLEPIWEGERSRHEISENDFPPRVHKVYNNTHIVTRKVSALRRSSPNNPPLIPLNASAISGRSASPIPILYKMTFSKVDPTPDPIVSKCQ